MNNLLFPTKYLAQKYGLHPQRKSGQNFLIEENILNQIIKNANLSPENRVLEIGAGFGALTQRLAARVKKVWAIELEKRFVPSLTKLSSIYPAIEVIKEDILKIDIGRLVGKRSYKVVANLPYNITSIVLRRFLAQDPKPKSMILMIQKEVAERIVASPGNLSLLAISVQFYGEPRIIRFVEKKHFWPEPKVDSALVKIKKIKSTPEIARELQKSKITEKQFFQVVRAGFSAKRKQIHNNLATSLRCNNQKVKEIFKKIKLDPRIRPQELSVQDWKRVAQALKRGGVI